MISYKIPVLLIDSNAFRANIIKQAIGEDYEIAYFSSVKDGDDYISRTTPALVFSDTEFPSVFDFPIFILEKDIFPPYSKEKIQGLLETYALPYMSRFLLVKERDSLSLENENLKEELSRQSTYLEKAGIVQQKMLKRSKVGSKVAVYAKSLPLLELSGDFYYYKQFGDELYFMIGDVVDHGAEAAIYMTELISFLFVLLQRKRRLKPLIREFCRIAQHYNPQELTATVFFGVLNVENGNLQYCSLGHNLPFIVGKTIKELKQPKASLPAGLNTGKDIHICTDIVLPGEKVFLYTDGLIEEFNSLGSSSVYGENKLQQHLATVSDASADRICEFLINDVLNYIAGTRQNDDILVLCIERLEGTP